MLDYFLYNYQAFMLHNKIYTNAKTYESYKYCILIAL